MKFISVLQQFLHACTTIRSTSWGYNRYYASHIQTCFNVIVSSYAEYHKLDPIQTKSTTIHHLKNTLTDRVAVNHCVVQSL